MALALPRHPKQSVRPESANSAKAMLSLIGICCSPSVKMKYNQVPKIKSTLFYAMGPKHKY